MPKNNYKYMFFCIFFTASFAFAKKILIFAPKSIINQHDETLEHKDYDAGRDYIPAAHHCATSSSC